MIHIVGDSHAPRIFRQATASVGIPLCEMKDAELVMICQDTPTDDNGKRDLSVISALVLKTLKDFKGSVVITSQVPPGFTRRFNEPRLFCQAETLRIKDALERALHPEQHIVGCMFPEMPLPIPYFKWLDAFGCPIFKMSYEEAEYSKIAINVSLAHQVTLTNNLAAKARMHGCDWSVIKKVLQHDHRMGGYLDPGDWTQSKHLLRDYVTFNEACKSDS